PGVKHAFITTREGTPKFKGTLGIEHASDATIQAALKGLYSVATNESAPVSKKFLRANGLTGRKASKQLRLALGEKLRIGYTNSKQLKKRLTMFGITEEEVDRTLKEMKKEGLDE